MPCAAPPTRVYRPGRRQAELGAAGLAVGLPDTAAEAECVAETAGFTVAGALPHDATATPMPITPGTAKCRDPYVHHCRLSW